jgi:hypothetical protein
MASAAAGAGTAAVADRTGGEQRRIDMKTVEWIFRQLRALGPYLAIELLLPGGSIVALLLWTYRHRTALRPNTRSPG